MKKYLALSIFLLAMYGCASIKDNVLLFNFPQSGENLTIDPNVSIGQLENGLTYYIRENRKPEKRANFYLAVNAGSVLEDENQQGLAHLVEHMAFNGTKHFKKQELVDYFETIGVAFGPDLNAYTSFDETVYMIEVPTDDKDIISQAIQILEDWAHGISFEEEDIDGERPVVGEEWRLGQGARQRMFNKILPVVLNNSQYASRLPIGKKAVIDTAHYSTIRKYYTDWYRPDLMAVVAVGDFDKTEMKFLIHQHFNRLVMPEDPRERIKFPVPDHENTLVAIATDVEAPYTSVVVGHKFDKKNEVTTEDYRTRIKKNLFSGMLKNRLVELTKEAVPKLIYGSANFDNMILTKDGFELFALVNDNDILLGIQTLIEERQRIKNFGFTQTELEREKTQIMRRMEKAFNEKDKTESRSYVREYVYNYLKGEPIPGIEVELNMHTEFLPDISLTEINSHTEDWMPDINRSVSVMAPEKEGVIIPTQTEILNLFNQVKSKPLQPYVDEVLDEPLLAYVPPSGSIVDTYVHTSVGLTEWTLGNGVRVLLKPTQFKNDEILFKAYSVGGTSLAEDDNFISAQMASDIVDESGIANFSSIQLEKKLSGKLLNISPYISDYYEGISGSSTPQDLETLFKLIYMKMTSPRLDSVSFNAYLARSKGWLENWKSRPEAVFQDSVAVTLSQNHHRKRPLTAELLSEIDLNSAFQFYNDRFGDAGDFTFVFVGNFSIENIEPLVLTYLGSLPTKRRIESWVDRNISPPRGLVEKSVFRGIEPKSLTQIYYSGKCKWDRQERYNFYSMIEVLRIKLREVLREDMGGVYGVRINGKMSKIPQETYSISIGFGCDPERVNELTEAVKNELKLFLDDGTTDKYLQKVKETQKRRYETDLKKNQYWLGVTEMMDKNEWDFDLVYQFNDLVEGLSLDTIRSTANQYFSTENIVQVTLYPEK